LLLDEVLAVGDQAFRIKCHSRISRIRRNAAVIFVSHDMPAVTLVSDRTVVLAQGHVRFEGDTGRGVEAYEALNKEDKERIDEGFVRCHPPLRSFEIAPLPAELPFGVPMIVDMLIDSEVHLAKVAFRVNAHNMAGVFTADGVAENRKGIGPGKTRSRIEIASLPLKAGRYYLSFSIADAAGEFLGFSSKRHEILVTGGHPGTATDCQLDVRSWTNVEESDGFITAMLQR
jgi:lipopolysaccharide transport system ATP-binding protein